MISAWEHYHGWVIFLYYIAGFAGVILMAHPYLLILTFMLLIISEWIFISDKNGRLRSMIKMLLFDVILSVFIVAVNALFNHRGPTLFMSLFGMRITKEAISYGIRMALLFIVCIRLFRQFSSVMTDEKILGIMAGRLPGLALVFSMLLRLVPYTKQRSIRLRQINMTDDRGIHGLKMRAGLYNCLFTMMLEDGIIRSISMNDRGYGVGKRRSFYKRRMVLSDVLMILFICIFIAVCVYIYINDLAYVRYFPTMRIDGISWYIYIIWGAFYIIPMLVVGKNSAVMKSCA